MFYLEQQSVSNFAFWRTGTQHRARWMSTPIYAFKMYLRRSQLDVDATLVNGLRRFCNFVSIFYAPYWLQCPLASEAAVNDLEFHRAMMNYSSVDEEVAEAARHAFLRHRWYLTAELILQALCFQQLPDIDYEKLTFSIYKSYQKHVSFVQNPTAPLIS